MIDYRISQAGRLVRVLDILLGVIAMVTAFWVRLWVLGEEPNYFAEYMALLPVLLLPQSYLLRRYGVYDTLRISSLSRYAFYVVKAVLISVLILTAFIYVAKIAFFSRGILLTYIGLNVAYLLLARASMIWWYFRRPDSSGLNKQKVLVVGTGDRALRLSEKLVNHSEWGIELIGFLDPVPDAVDRTSLPAELLGSVDDIEAVISSRVVDSVVCALPRSMWADLENAVDACQEQGVEFVMMADVVDFQVARVSLHDLGGTPLMACKPVEQDETALLMKRAFDLFMILLMLPLLLPFFCVVAIAVKLDSPGPVFFTQQRVGFRKRRFPMIKFRSMYVDAEARLKEIEHLNEAEGPIFKMANDPRITRVGRLLRKSSMDELPQLINVLLGHMSLVGPRPMSVRDVDLFDKAEQRKRFSVKPGMTGLWQVSGRSNLPFERWLELDLEYIDNWSLALDMKILLKTVPAVLLARGAV